MCVCVWGGEGGGGSVTSEKEKKKVQLDICFLIDQVIFLNWDG